MTSETMIKAMTEPTETLARLIERDADGRAIADHLDALEPTRRVEEIEKCPGRLLGRLWNQAKGNSSMTMDAFLPETERTLIYRGRNSMPVFSLFEKRFFRKADGSTAIGHNQQFWNFFTGPGYFTAREGEAGEVVFDYTRTPDWKPIDWPKLRANTGFGPGMVYGGLLDYNRWVSQTTIIGSAYRRGRSLDTYYLVTRVS